MNAAQPATTGAADSAARVRATAGGSGRALLGVAGLAVLVALGGCGRSAARAREQAEREARVTSQAQSRELMDALDAVEARLYNGRASLKLWSELGDRHRQVSALACDNAAMHARGLEAAARHNAGAEERLGRRIAATHTGVVSDAHVTGYKTTTSAGAANAAPAKTLP